VLLTVALVCATGCSPTSGPTAAESSASPARGPSEAVEVAAHCSDIAEPDLPPAPPAAPPAPRPSPEPATPDASDVQAWADANAPDTFAGLWLTSERPQRLVIAFTDEVEAHAQQLRADLGISPIAVRHAHSVRALDAIQDEIVADLLSVAPGAAPARIIAVYTSVQINRVAVQLLGDGDQARADLHARYGDAVCVEVSPVNDADDAVPSPWEAAGPVAADATAVDILVQEMACASGQSADGRIEVLDVRYETDQVVATIGVVPRDGAQTCQGHPPTPYTLQLDEPLDGRPLVDGYTPPPAPEPTPTPTPEGPPWTLEIRVEPLDGDELPPGLQLQVHVVDVTGRGVLSLDWDEYVASIGGDPNTADFVTSVRQVEVAGPFVEVTSILRVGTGPEEPVCRTAVERPSDGVASLVIRRQRAPDGTCADTSP
jgi:hypothetical protein